MIRPWTRNKTFLLIIIILTFIAIYFISSLSTLSPLRAELATVASELTVYETQVEKIADQIDQAEGDDQALNEVLLKIPLTKSSDNVLSTIHQIAHATKLTVESMSSLGAVTDSETEVEEVERALSTRHTYSLSVSANTLVDLNRFLDQLLIQDRLLTIDTLNVNQADDHVTASIVFSTFYAAN